MKLTKMELHDRRIKVMRKEAKAKREAKGYIWKGRKKMAEVLVLKSIDSCVDRWNISHPLKVNGTPDLDIGIAIHVSELTEEVLEKASKKDMLILSKWVIGNNKRICKSLNLDARRQIERAGWVRKLVAVGKRVDGVTSQIVDVDAFDECDKYHEEVDDEAVRRAKKLSTECSECGLVETYEKHIPTHCPNCDNELNEKEQK